MNEYGHFTTMRVEAGGVRGLARHAERLRADGEALFGTPASMEEVRRAALRAVGEHPATLRIAVTAGDVGRPGGGELRVEASVRPPTAGLAPLRLAVVEQARALPRVKHLGLVPELHARREAQLAGYDDALLAAGGEICEGPTWALLLLSGSRLVRPAAPTLPSITAALLAECHRGPVETASVRPAELAGFDAALAVNAGWGVRRVAGIGTTTYRDSPLVDALAAAYTAWPLEPLDSL